MSPIIPPLDTSIRRFPALERESSVTSKRVLEQATADAASRQSGPVDVDDLEFAFPSLDTVTRRIMKAMFDSLEKAAEAAAQRAADAQRQQQQEDLAAQDAKLIGASRNPDSQDARSEARVPGQKAPDGKQRDTQARVIGQDGGQQTPEAVEVGVTSSSTAQESGAVLLENVKRAMRQEPAVPVAQVHDFRLQTSTPAPDPKLADYFA